MLRGAPSSPRYIKERAPSLVNQIGSGDLNYNQLNGSGWSYWTQTDWSGGYQQVQFKDNASFNDGRKIDVTSKYGQASIQPGWTSATKILSGNFNAYAVHRGELLFGMDNYSQANSGRARILKITSAAGASAVVSAYTAISAVHSMTRFNNLTIIGLAKGLSAGTRKTMSKYDGTTLSAFRSANPVVRAVRGVGIRLYSGERVTSLSGDVLYYSTDLATFTSAYQAGKNSIIKYITDLNGSPYLFVTEGPGGNRVNMFRYDEGAARVYPIYTWENLTNFSVSVFLSKLIIAGLSGGKNVAYSFDGARIAEIFDDQTLLGVGNWSRSMEFQGNLHFEKAMWDGQYWFPGFEVDGFSSRILPVANFANKAWAVSHANNPMQVMYRDTTKYSISGYLVSSEFGHNIAGVDKLLNAVDINMDALAANQTIDVQRSVDGGSTFTSIGTAKFSVDGAVKKKTLYFPSGFVTKLWNYKLQLAGPGTSTPTVKAVTFQYRPIPDLKKRWSLSIDSGNDISLLNNQKEQRDGKALMQDLWLEMEAKRMVQYEDVDAFEVGLVSAMTSAGTSALVDNTRLMPPKGRMRIRKSNQNEEMTYTSADGGKIKGISRGQKSTLARAYTSADTIDNYYSVVVTDVKEQVNNTDQNKTESIANVVLLEV